MSLFSLKIRIRVPPQPECGFVGQIHRHVERVRQHYEDHYAQHPGPDAPPPPPPPRPEPTPRLADLIVPGELERAYAGVLDALKEFVFRPASANDDSDTNSSTDETV